MILVLDTETSDFKGRIMQAAYCRYGADSSKLLEYTSLLRHDAPYEVHEEAAKIHGLTRKHCQLNGDDAWWVLKELVREIERAEIVVGHKLQFDLAMISKDCFCYGVKFEYSMTDPRMVCTMAASKAFCNLKDTNGRPKFPSLSELHFRLFGTTFEGAHDALSDVRATARCYFELKRRGVIA